MKRKRKTGGSRFRIVGKNPENCVGKTGIFGRDCFSKKDYCKLFFVWENEDKTRAVYQQEGLRYLLPNLYNSNDFTESRMEKFWDFPITIWG